MISTKKRKSVEGAYRSLMKGAVVSIFVERGVNGVEVIRRLGFDVI